MQSAKKIPSLTIITPCYNEEEVLKETIKILHAKLIHLIEEQKITEGSQILFVDDGSRDKTWEIIENCEINLVRGIKLAKNSGHQNALWCGYENCDSDISISIDADLQDDVECINKMLDEYLAGADIVYAVRNDRTTDTFFKRITANTYYKLLQIMGVEGIPNHADFRLLSQRAIKALLQFKEKNLYIRGLIPKLGFHTAYVFYKRAPRLAGESKYPFFKMLALAINGITSLSVFPLKLITLIGFVTCFISIILFIYTFLVRFFSDTTLGWSSLMIVIVFFSGVQLLSLGIIGEYLGKIYIEIKDRPKYIIENKK